MAENATADATANQSLKNDVQQLTQHINRLQADLAVLAKDVGQAAKAGVAVAKEGVRQAYDVTKDTARHTYDATKETAAHALEMAREKSAEATDGVRNQVRKHPLTSIGVAVGAGVLLGMLLSRSRD